jgi:hypothetical protein|tara:strand:+ start:137 stop:328 length:192 start_codon:yes stop_codon:yes gene_type:complete
MTKKYTIEEIKEAVDLVTSNKQQVEEVIDILETDVEKNTRDYIEKKKQEQRKGYLQNINDYQE